MSYKVEKHADLPALIITLNADYDLLNEIEYSNKDSIEILSKSDELLYLIIVFDVRLDFPSIMAGTQNVTRSDNALFLHPKVKQVCFVTEDKAIELTSKGYASPAFGSLDVGLFKSLDEALAYVSEQ